MKASKISFAGRAAALRRLLRELLRAGAFPLHGLLFLFRFRRERAATAELLDAGQLLDDAMQRAHNDAARGRFAQRLEQSLAGKAMRRVFVACGEPSGEAHACLVVDALRAARPDIELRGFGGRELESHGVQLVENLVDHAVMGFFRVVARIPFWMGVVARFATEMREHRPDVVILVDNPGLNVVLAEEAKRLGIPVLYYILPQYWAWGPWRMKRFRRAVDGAIAILPFEAALFEAHDVPTGFAGSPLLQRVPQLSADAEREKLVCLLPGSRRSEVEGNLPGLVELWRRFSARHQGARAVLPQPDERRAKRVREILREHLRGRDAIEGLEVIVDSAWPWLARARAALVKSGTTTLQTALCATPFVVFYRVGGRCSLALSRVLVTTPSIVAPNLVLARNAYPEFLYYRDVSWGDVESELELLWADGPTRDAQLEACREVRELVDGDGSAAEVARWLEPVGSV